MASGCQADTPTAKEALCAADCLLHELEKEVRS